jgi:hypothetical protein
MLYVLVEAASMWAWSRPATSGAATPVASVPARVSLKPSGGKTVNLKFVVPAQFATGSYVLSSLLSVLGVPDTDVSNNLF